jgi:hypothetical protein
MKFCYVDESGDRAEGDILVMCGLLVDAHRLRKKTEDFDGLLRELFAQHPGSPQELKTKAFMRGNGGWNVIPRAARKEFLTNVCTLAIEKGDKIYGLALSFGKFDEQIGAGQGFPFGTSYWVCAGMFISSLIQRKMQDVDGRKGITALVVDDNKVDMPRLSEGLFTCPAWYDGLYQRRTKKKQATVWVERKPDDRFDQIINTGFAIKSQHSSLVQVADSIAWTYRRHLELQADNESFEGEKVFYAGLVEKLDDSRMTLGHTPECDSRAFYEAVRNPAWKL